MGTVETQMNSLRDMCKRVSKVEEGFQDLREHIARLEEASQGHMQPSKGERERRMSLLDEQVQKLVSGLKQATDDIQAHGEMLVGLLEEGDGDTEQSGVSLDEYNSECACHSS